MLQSRMTSRGQVTIPVELRERLGLQPGDRVDFAPGPGRTLVVFPRSPRVRALAGLRQESEQPQASGVSREELNVLLKDWPAPARRKVG